MKDAFRSMDKDGNGSVEVGEIATYLDKHNIQYTDDMLKALGARFDKNNDGKVNYIEFVKFLQSHSQFSGHLARSSNIAA